MNASNIARKLGQRLGRLRAPTLLRWGAGHAAAVRPTRRGSVLVLILGALAMLGVIIVTYAVVGQETRRTGAVVVRRDSINDTTRRIGDYIAGVISNDIFSTAVQTTDANGDPVLVREAWDYPFTDYTMRVDSTNPLDEGSRTHAFNPIGTFYAPLTGGGREFRLASDPWLASTTPILYEPGATPDNTAWRDEATTWGHVSNLSPDGRFVNLFNLRGDFDARPGTGNGEMSDGLTLWDQNGNVVNTTAWGDTADPDVPAHWDTLQLSDFHPAKDVVNAPNTPEYAPYQWADADGDGLFDSRWFELVHAGDPSNIRSLLPSDDRFRWFVAARVVDLSGLINVNTATDLQTFRTAATPVYPLGLKPADVDLRRILTLHDTYAVSSNPVGYEGLEVGTGNADYSSYLDDAASVGDAAYAALRAVLWPAGPAMDAQVRSLYYTAFGSNAGGAGFMQINNQPTMFASPLFGLDDLLELLTYRGVNNPDATSALEAAVGGKYAGEAHLSPLRSNRDLQLERGGHDSDGDGELDGDGKAWSASDVRQLLTTVSGARPLLSTLLPSETPADLRASLGVLSAADVQLNAIAALEQAILPAAATDREDVFAAFADALLPYSGLADAWTDPRLATAHYGYNPELALRSAAHLAANLIDSYDRDGGLRHEPRAHTLIISEEGRAALEQRPDLFYAEDTTGGNTLFDLGAQRLAPAAANPTADILNIYGVEAQPFLTNVATFFLYTDAPSDAGGDDDTTEPFITIDGTVPTDSSDNADFLGQIVAFQITNPFDVEVRLTRDALADGDAAPTDEYTDYYLTFGGHHFKIVEVNTTTGQMEAVTLRPGETKVFFALNALSDEAQGLTDPYEVLAQRFSRIDPAVTRDDIVQIIDQQLSVMDEGSGTDTDPILIARMDRATGDTAASFADLLSDEPTENMSVGLWRVLRAGPLDATGDNSPANDMLADRIAQPADASTTAFLDRRMPPENQKVEAATSPQYDTGFSIVYWASLRRNANPTDTLPQGAFPAYCVEPRWSTAAFQNVKESDGKSTSAPNLADFEAPYGAASFGEFLDLLRQDDAPIVDSMTEHPEDWNTNTIPQHPLAGIGYDEMWPAIAINNRRFRIDPDGTPDNGDEVSTLRIADLLIPLIVGPCAGYNTAAAVDDEPERLTLSEAVAMALGYSTPPNLTDPVFGVYATFADPSLAATDRGHLRLDDYAPYVDRNSNGQFEPDQDERLAPGIPLALNVLNLFTTLDPQVAGRTRMTPGVININTAPRTVLGALPLARPIWPIPGINDVDGTLAGHAIDIAAPIEGYRDRIAVPDLYDNPVNYADGSFDPADPATWDGRALTTLNPAQRSQPGFASPGELMAITNDATATTGRVPPADAIDFLGRRDPATGAAGQGDANGAPGMSLFLVDNDGDSTTPPMTVDEIEDDFSERLLIGAGLSNVISVRSDVYAVWFVVHGYQRSDTEGLRDADPLVPTVAKRFVMVVDRSKVRMKGQKPEILLLKEVPM